jgi:hypothetical protein
MSSKPARHPGSSERWAKLLEQVDLDQTDQERVRWLPEELEDVWRDQLSAPVEFAPPCLALEASDGSHYANADRPGTSDIGTFGELFSTPRPPVELLVLTKDFAKRNLAAKGGLLPREIVQMLYYASLAAGLERLGKRLSRLDNAMLKAGFDWAIAQPWVDESTRQLMQQARVPLMD